MEPEKKDPQKKNEKDWLQITELFMARCGKKDWNRTFIGSINRENDESGNETAVSGKFPVYIDGHFWSRASSQDEFRDNIDEIVELRLDYGLHNDPGVSSVIADEKFFHN
jgi:hypothetical protein